MENYYFVGLLILSTLGFEVHSSVIENLPKQKNLFRTDPKLSPSSTGDVEILYDAIQSEDTYAIMDILARRTLAERLDISDYYNFYYDQDLLEDLEEILSGDFKNLIVAMLTPRTKYYAGEIWNAVVGIGTDEMSLTEILITLNNDQINQTAQYYYEAHQETLDEAIADDASGFFEDFLASLAHADRDEDDTTNVSDAIDDAYALHSSNDTLFTTYNDIFTHRSYPQLQLIFEEYKDLYDETIETAIEDNFSGDVADGLLALAKKVQNEPAYFAQRFYESMAGWGTSDTVLIRLAVTRSEIDIEEVKTEYKDRYTNSLADDIIDETSGDYQTCLLILINEENAKKSTKDIKETKSP